MVCLSRVEIQIPSSNIEAEKLGNRGLVRFRVEAKKLDAARVLFGNHKQQERVHWMDHNQKLSLRRKNYRSNL
ncbi:hypothetical protein R1flu_006347 [Riccia fluitans]|uniref:Uncharacterized protein n=1 Tax=Riccia fluitans TaxID=41844 RepID=A0ABD1YWH1_9MARC